MFVFVSVANPIAGLPGELLAKWTSDTVYPPTPPEKSIVFPFRTATNPAPQFTALNAVDVLQLRVVPPFCNDRKASAFAAALSATSNAADPNAVTSDLLIHLSSGQKI